VGAGGVKGNIPENAVAVTADITANVWDILVNEGDQVKASSDVLVLEAMKMEISVPTPISGTVHSIWKSKNEIVQQGDTLMYIMPEKIGNKL
jgi:urea carboxylase